MLSATVELFLTNYFYITALIGNFLGDRKNLFDRLAKIFFIPREGAERLFRIADSRELQEIDSLNKFNQYSRLLEYYGLLGKSPQTTPECDEVIRIKGNVFASLKGTPLEVKGNAPRQVVYHSLIAAANEGFVSALFTCGLLQCEGIFFDKNFKAGIKKLNNAADWLDIVSLLALIEYDEDHRGYNLARLEVATCNTPCENLAREAAHGHVALHYAGDLSASALLMKAFTTDTMKREQYDSKILRILMSSVLSFSDKEKLICFGNKDLFSAVSNLPLKLGKRSFADMMCSCKLKLPFNRPAEQEEVEGWLTRFADNSAQMRPLCISCESEYIQSLYDSAITGALDGAHVVRIDISSLTSYDLEPSPGNVFVRNIDEDKLNVFVLSARGDLNEQALSVAINFARGDSRKQFHIGALGVSIDLSGIMIIGFCDAWNAGAFKQHFQVMQLKDLSAEERKESVDRIISTRAKVYGLTTANISDEAYSSMRDCSIDQAERALDAAIRLNSTNHTNITITTDMLAPQIRDTRQRTMGFGREAIYDK